uniref:Uncharacterized protein n=1 Tax=uncultured marine group II/III euryarchaeote AD1000_65_F06 TaxID=1457795 RepID=A0A075FVU8_9EURY|nr:hypothetical protein [uncultured marine group II/III euryarchaeote AD1000_65_F06]
MVFTNVSKMLMVPNQRLVRPLSWRAGVEGRREVLDFHQYWLSQCISGRDCVVSSELKKQTWYTSKRRVHIISVSNFPLSDLSLDLALVLGCRCLSSSWRQRSVSFAQEWEAKTVLTQTYRNDEFRVRSTGTK